MSANENFLLDFGSPSQSARGGSTSAQRPTRIPISVYVMWHPSFEDGPGLAREIYEWLNAFGGDTRALGQGIPVHFLSEPLRPELAIEPWHPPEQKIEEIDGEPDWTLQSFRKKVNLHHARHNVFVPLVEDHMVNDASWRRDLLEIATAADASLGNAATESGQVHFVPLQLTRAWARMPPAVSKWKALYLDRWSDSQQETAEQRTARRLVRVRRLVTQALVGLLRRRAGDLLPTQVFLSHAKMDKELGPKIAERLRDVAAGYGQIEVFYDENDLPSGEIGRGR